jgi:hypothetical protein
MERKTTATDGSNRSDVFSPTQNNSVSYLSPAITVEGALQFRVTPTVAIAVGLLMWADNASIWGNNSTPASAPRTVLASGQLPALIPTPEYHLATGPQVFLGPFLGTQFGP